MTSRRQFAQQYSENDLVHKVKLRVHLQRMSISSEFIVLIFCFSPEQELEKLNDDAKVYKLIGPALIKQDKVEALSNVAERLDFIENET